MIPTVPVTVTASDQSGNPVAGARVIATLDQTEIYQGFVAPEKVEAFADASGVAVLNLWPNALGVAGSRYKVRAWNPDTGKRFLDVLAAVPNSACNLHQILVQEPYPPIDAAQQALIAAQAALAPVTEQAAIATDAAEATAADRIQTRQDAQATAADRTQTGLDRQATAADRIATGQDRVQTGQDRTATGADRLQTGLDAQATAADRIATGQDAQATAADRIATGQDKQATAADRIATGQDRQATAADRTQTGLDRAQTLLDRQAAATSQNAAAASATTATTQAGIATTAATTATTQAGIATAQANTATTAATTATTQAGIATTKATEAAGSAAAAAASAALIDPVPTIPAFVNVTSATLGALTESNAVTVTGSSVAVWPALVRGDGSPEVQVNAGPWSTSATFRAGDSLKLRLTAPPTAGLNYVATLYPNGAAGSMWTVSTLFNPLTLFAAGEQGVWYDPSDMSTMFQDAAGTTPVTAVEQPVGLMLDKSKGLVLGPELVVNGDFSNGTTGWTLTASASVVASALSVTTAVSELFARQFYAIQTRKRYRVTFDLTVSAGSVAIYLGRVAGAELGGVFTTSGSKTLHIAVGTSDGYSCIFQSGVAGFTGTIDNISVRELPGNHATQPTATARPVLSARVNLATHSENLIGWINNGNGIAITSNAVADPNGEMTADTLAQSSVTNASRALFNGGTAIRAGQPYTTTFWVRRVSGTDTQPTLAVYGIGVFPSQSFTATSDWQKITWNWTALNDGNRYEVGAIAIGWDLNGAPNNNVYSIWGFDVRLTNQSTLPYQRVNTATDYDADPTKFPKRLNFDNLDDAQNIAFPSALGSNCTVARAIPGVGAQILTGQTIGTSFSNTITHAGMVIIDRALTVSESNNLTTYLNEKAGV